MLRSTAATVPPKIVTKAPYQRREAYRHSPGKRGVEPTRFGDWEYNGRCTDFE
jgi:hypothetical protein